MYMWDSVTLLHSCNDETDLYLGQWDTVTCGNDKTDLYVRHCDTAVIMSLIYMKDTIEQ